MLLGKDKDLEPRGPLAPLKKKWAELEPKKQKTITLLIVGLAIVVFAGLGYQAERQRNTRTRPDGAIWRLNMSLWTDLPQKPENWTYQSLQARTGFSNYLKLQLMSSGESCWPYKGAHLLDAARPDVSKGHCHHYCCSQANSCLHFGFSTYVMFFETEIVI